MCTLARKGADRGGNGCRPHVGAWFSAFRTLDSGMTYVEAGIPCKAAAGSRPI